MNERIQELSKQAGLKIEYLMINPPKPLQILGSVEQFEKFAELIVRQCAEVVKWTPSQYPNDAYVKNIKEHFGVEE